MKRKRAKKRPKKFPVFLLFVVGGLIIVLLALVFFFLFPKEPASMYVYPENPKQGDTVFIRVKSQAGEITGNLGTERLVFYRKGKTNEWISFLGIDADDKPGDYKISVDTSKAEHLAKEIKVALAGFSSAPIASAPAPTKAGQTKQKVAETIVKTDNSALKKILSKLTPAPYFTASFIFPLSTMEKTGFSFGKFISFAKTKLQHFGVDLKAPAKTEIHSINDGKVVATLDLPDYGKTVIIDHGLDIFSLYLHLEEFKVATGDIVKRGQLIGLSGDTGYVTAPHLHFSIRVGASRVDPIVFIQTTKKLDENAFIAAISEAFMNLINSFK